MKKKPYTCPRCAYVTALKTDMFKHLYKLKKTCPGQESLIELTEEVKQSILNNRVYIPEKVHQPNTIINNYNNVNNFIAGLDVLEKLSKYMKHKNTGLIGFEQAIEDKYSRTVRKLEDDSWKYGFELKRDDLLDIIDQISKVELTVDSVKTFEDLNIYYDKNADKLKIYDGEWEEMLTNKGIKKIVEVIKDCYWSTYECYLLRKFFIESNAFNRQKCRELLVEYFKFIGCFDVEPFVKNKDNDEIMGRPVIRSGDDEFSISEEMYPLYVKTRDNIKKSEINEVKKSVLDIIRKNSDRNTSELNKRIFELFNMDREFKDHFLTVVSL